VTPHDEFIAAFDRAIAERTLVSLVLSKSRQAAATCRACASGRSSCAASGAVLRLPPRDPRRDQEPRSRAARAAVVALLDPQREPSFAHATLHAGDAELQLRFSKKGKQALRALGAPRRDAAAGGAGHDRAKPRALPLELPFWVDLGIADERHRLVPSMARKWKQIDKFLEVLEHALDDAG
jgi:hypothetical protein